MSDIGGLFELPAGMPAPGVESTVTVRFDPGHALFRGHFPSRAVVPGVCLVAAAAHIASAMQGRELRVAQARTIKFLAPVDPAITPELLYHTKVAATNGTYLVEAQAKAGDAVVMKLTAEMAPL